MFNKEKWSKINLSEYRDNKIISKKSDNSIIGAIDLAILERYETDGNLLKGIPFAIKDNFAIKGTHTTAASKIIRELRPTYTATVFTKLLKEGAKPLFKANLDELAMGGTGLTSNYGSVHNPFNNEYIVGGSSSGSNYLVADKTVPFSIGSDTGDSVRKPAAFTGIVGFKPTWGLVSRYGLYDFAPSWDTVAWFTNDIKESALIMDVLKGYDPKDQSSLHTEDKNFLKEIELNESYKIVVIPGLENYIKDEEILIDYKKAISLLRDDGHKIIEANDADLKKLSAIIAVYRVISSVEAFSCNSNLTGFHFGTYFGEGKDYDEKMTIARTKGFSYEVKKRFLWSQESRFSEEKEYLKAIKMRRVINDEINRIISLGDIILTPTTPNLTDVVDLMTDFAHDNVLNNFLTIFNSNGSPSLSMPITKNGHKSTSVTISALPFEDKKVFKLSNRLEELL